MSGTTFLNGRVALWAGDCREMLQGFESNSFDSVVTDPPYALVSIVKRFANSPRSEKTEKQTNPYGRTGRGFMGQRWDTGETAFAVEFWAEVLRVLKPGGHVVAFSGTRTYHRMVCAIEDAGFEIRDQLAWTYGTGFNKRGYIHKDEAGKPVGPWGGALKPAWEPIVLARKPLAGTVAANVLEHGTGALNIDGCRVDLHHGDDRRLGGQGAWTTKIEQSGDTVSLPRGTVRSSPLGRWPANIIHDGSDEVVAAFPAAPGQLAPVKFDAAARKTGNVYGAMKRGHEPSANSDNAGDVGFRMKPGDRRLDSGSAARFFYSAKADANDRLGSKHPTVKPVDLMQWLCRLVTPPGGLVLDPFAGTGTTGEAAWREGFRAVLIEREAEYQADIVRRMELCLAGPEERRREIMKRKPEPPKEGLLALMDDEEAA